MQAPLLELRLSTSTVVVRRRSDAFITLRLRQQLGSDIGRCHGNNVIIGAGGMLGLNFISEHDADRFLCITADLRPRPRASAAVAKATPSPSGLRAAAATGGGGATAVGLLAPPAPCTGMEGRPRSPLARANAKRLSSSSSASALLEHSAGTATRGSIHGTSSVGTAAATAAAHTPDDPAIPHRLPLAAPPGVRRAGSMSSIATGSSAGSLADDEGPTGYEPEPTGNPTTTTAAAAAAAAATATASTTATAEPRTRVHRGGWLVCKHYFTRSRQLKMVPATKRWVSAPGCQPVPPRLAPCSRPVALRCP